MTAPNFRTTAEARAAIKKIEHNVNLGKPTGIAGGSATNQTTLTPGVTSTTPCADEVSKRGSK